MIMRIVTKMLMTIVLVILVKVITKMIIGIMMPLLSRPILIIVTITRTGIDHMMATAKQQYYQ